MKFNVPVVNVIGAGFAGIECALFLADHGINVHLFDVKKNLYSCDCSDCEILGRAEDNQKFARDLLRQELKILGSHLVEKELELLYNEKCQGCIANKLLEYGNELVKKHKRIERFDICINELNLEDVNVVATGPHTQGSLFEWLKDKFGSMRFYDSYPVYPILSGVKEEECYKNDNDKFLYIPLDYNQYIELCNNIIKARNSTLEKGKKISNDLASIEEMVIKNKDYLKNNILRPVFLEGVKEKPYAVIKLKKVDRGYSLEGFASSMPAQEQYEIIASIKPLSDAVVLRTGKSNENTYINAPYMVNQNLQSLKNDNVFFAGNIAGVYGHEESMALGIYVGYNIVSMLNYREIIPLPKESCIGAMIAKIISQSSLKFDPIIANYDIIEIDKVYKTEKGRNAYLMERSIKALEKYKEAVKNGKHV